MSDETNSVIGVALATGELPAEVAEVLRSVQNELFDLGADLSNPLKPRRRDARTPHRAARHRPARVVV